MPRICRIGDEKEKGELPKKRKNIGKKIPEKKALKNQKQEKITEKREKSLIKRVKNRKRNPKSPKKDF